MKRGFVFLVLVLSLFLVSAVSFSFNSPSGETESDSVGINLNFFNATGLLDFVFNWGSTNYSVYDEDLILMMDFNNDSDLGESDSLVADLSRYGHNGTVLGGASAVSSGKYHGAYSFSEGEGINISASEYFNVDEFTISLWVKPDKTRKVIDLDSRDLHTCYIDGNNDAWCFGDNTAGKLGDGTTTQSYLPVRVSGDYKFREIAVSEDASCGILTNDSVVCWGEGGTGELGNGGTIDSSTPVFVDTTLNFTSLTSANHLMCGYLENGSAVCWGYGSSGQFGDGVSSNRLIPAFIAPSWNFTQYTFGEVHTCGILYNGTAYCWGNNGEGERGDNSTLDTQVNTPVPVLTDNYTFKWIDAGEDQNCGILTNGSLMCWGENQENQLGVEGIDRSTYPIFSNTTISNFDRVYLSKHVGFGFLENGSVVAWGYPIYSSSYGSEDYNFSTVPKIINWNFDYEIDTLTNPVWNSEHYCFINEGLPYCWGENQNLESGVGFFTEQSAFPVKFSINSNLKEGYDKFYSNVDNYCFKKENKYYCAGYNFLGALGINSPIGLIFNPVKIYGDYNFSDLYLNRYHSCGILTNGSAMCWGRNNEGSLGDNTTQNKFIPTFVYGEYNFSLISSGSGGAHTCGILTNGSAMCWGKNLNGQIGDNTTIERNIPVSIYGEYNFSFLSTGGSHTCGLLTNGSAMCWGRNNFGQLGDSQNCGTECHIPVSVYGNYNFSNIYSGTFHTCGILTNGSAMCWGWNLFGQLGNNDTSNSFIPISILGNYSFSSLSISGTDTCGLLTNGSAMCWGRNLNGLGGSGHKNPIYSPSFVLGDLIFSEIGNSFSSICGILNNSKEIYCWGNNRFFNMGHELLPPSSPISIYTEDIFSKESQQFRIGLTYDGNLRAIYALRYFDYDLSEGWNNVVLNVGDEVELYVNGELVDTHDEVIIPKDILDDLEIGKNSNAQIDDLMMWNRSLTDSEIEFIYKSNLEKLNETSWSFTTSFSDLAEATYRYGVFAQDSFGWFGKLRNLLVDFPEASQGGSTGGATSLTFTDGVVKRGFPKGHVLKLSTGSLTVGEFSQEKVSLSFDSSEVSVEVGKSEKVDLDQDGFYDYEISYSGSTGNFANLVITEIHEKVSGVQEEAMVEDSGVVGEEEIEEKKGFFARLWNWFVGLFGF